MTSAKKRSNKRQIGKNITNHILLGHRWQKENQKEEEREKEVEQACQIRA